MKKVYKCMIVFLLGYSFGVMGNVNLRLEYGKYLPDFMSDISYPESSKLITFSPEKEKKVIYLSAFQASDVHSIERRVIEDIIAHERPDICILEGFPVTEGINPARIIEIAQNLYTEGLGCENTYAAYLCHKYGVPFMGGELAESDPRFYRELRNCGYSKKDIVFFMILHQIPYWDKDHKLQVDNIKEQFERFMYEKLTDWLQLKITYTYEDFLAWYYKNFTKNYDPYTDFKWTFPSISWADRREGSFIFQKICADQTNIRDNHIIKVIKESVKSYNKVFVIFSASSKSNHYISQKKALETFLGSATEVDLEGIFN